MENTSYHSVQRNKCPIMASRKWEMAAWLQHSNITFGDGLLKEELYELINSTNLSTDYM